jgi:AcrR family transcriptional regulator
VAGQEVAARTRRRADAEVNRARILKAAHAALEESGDASMQSIAKRAGIGQGTLYRHFPTREALVLEVHRRDVTDLVDAAPRLLKDHPPAAALRAWLDRLAEYGLIKRGLAGAFHAATHQQLAEEGYAPVIGAINLLLQAGKRDGSIRTDIDGAELLLLVGFLWSPDADPDREARVRHMLDLVMDALRVPAGAATEQNDT